MDTSHTSSYSNPDLQFPEISGASLSVHILPPFPPPSPACLPGVRLWILPALHGAASGKSSSPPTFEGELYCPLGSRSALSSHQPAPAAESQPCAICLLPRELPEVSFIFAFLVLGITPGTESELVNA